MRYAIVSDIHANLQAWQATLADIQKVGVHQIVCLGDVVGYGPNPQEVYESVREVTDGCILGNHDAVVCNRLDPIAFNPNARRIIEWTADQLDDEAKSWFGDLPMIIESNSFDCSHAEFEVPGRFRYIFSAQDALPSFRCSDKPALFVGHTHRPGAIVLDSTGVPRSLPGTSFDFLEDCRYLINVGSVGDPRNGETTGSYAILDVEDGSLDFRKVQFDIDAYGQAIKKSGLQTKPMLFNFVGPTPPKKAATDDQPEDEFKPSDTNLATAPSTVPSSGTIDSSPSASPNGNKKGGADAESVGRGAALLLIPLVIVGGLLLMTRPDPPKQPIIPEPPAETPVTALPNETTPSEITPPADRTTDQDTSTSAQETPPAVEPTTDTEVPPKIAVAPSTPAIQWPEEHSTFPGRAFRLNPVADLESIMAVAEAVVAGAPELADKRAQQYVEQHAELAAAAPETYEAFAAEVAAVSRWQQSLASSFEQGIGQSGKLKTMYGEHHVQIQSVVANGIHTLIAKPNSPAVESFIPFDDLPHEERNKRLAGPTPEATAIMRGISNLRAGLADDAKRSFAGVGSILAQGLLTLTIENQDILHNREGHRATAIIYQLLQAPANQPPEALAAALSKQRIPMARLAQLRRAVTVFRQRFGNTASGSACAPLLAAIEGLTPDFITPTAPNVAHAFPMTASSTSNVDGESHTRLDDSAQPEAFAKIAAEMTSVPTAAGDLVSLLRQTDCPTIPLASSLHGNPAITIAFWAYAPESSTTRTAISLGSSDDQNRFAIKFTNTLTVFSGENQWDTGIPVRNELWQYHVVTRGEGGSLAWWTFDQKIASGRLPGTLDLKGDLLLGADLGGLKGTRRVDVFRGLLKDVHVYPRILLDDEIRKLTRQARTFAVAAGLNTRITSGLSTELPSSPTAAFSPKELPAGVTIPAAGVEWTDTKDLKALHVTGTLAVAAPIPADVNQFTALAVAPSGDDIRGAVFRVRAVPGTILAESLLVPPGKSVQFTVPLSMKNGRIQLETTVFGAQTGQSTWIAPGFSQATAE